jgi:pimeloyl-ACP methyl ester carboxylesterase
MVPAVIIFVLAGGAVWLLYSTANSLFEYGVHMRTTIAPDPPEAPLNEVPERYMDSAYHLEALQWMQEQRREDVEISTHDGLSLRGYLISNDRSKDAAIAAPGWTGRKENLFAEAKLLYDCGLNVLVFDQRAHGASEGEYASFGFFESQDLSRWVTFLKNRGFERIALYGHSMGAATVMMAAGSMPEGLVSCAIEDCGFTSMRDAVSSFVRGRVRWLPPFTYPLLLRFAVPIIKKNAGYSVDDASPIDRMPFCTVPMLFIHGTEDSFVPYDMMPDLYEAHPGPKERLDVEGAGHIMSLSTDNAAYVSKVQTFINKYITQ